VTCFVLLASQRSGSTWVLNTLNAHPAVVTYGELFIEGGRDRTKWAGERDIPHWERWRHEIGDDLEAFLDHVFRPRSGIAAVGFKLMYGQAGANPALVDSLERREVAILHLVRRNLLDVVVSQEAAVASGVFHAREGEPAPPPVTVRVNAGELVQRLTRAVRETERARQRFARPGRASLEVAYEDLLAEPSGFEAVLAFLGVPPPPRPLASTLQKLVTKPRRETIENYDRVAAVLAGTPFAWMVRDEVAAP